MLLQTALAISVLMQISGSQLITDSACKGPGVNPHPYDSKQFMICANDHGKLLVAETVPCPEGYVYSSSEKTCVRGQQSQLASPPTNSRRTRAAAAGACKASGPNCEGCDRLVICANMGDYVLSAIANISCSEISPDMTCNKGSCTTKPSANQLCDGSDQAGAFRCLQPGFFPDYANCKMFHFCGSDLSHFSGECDEEFNATTGTCTSTDFDKTQQQATGCAKEQWCKENNTAPIKFTSYPSYYVICIPVTTNSRKSFQFYQMSVAKCPESQVFNNDSRVCEIACNSRRGRLPDPDNCSSYFECSSNNSVTKKTCPENQAFDKSRKLCLPETMVLGCQRTPAVETSTPKATTITQAITAASLPTTTQIIPNVGFQCQSNGAFPDDSDCSRYIVCSLESRSDGVRFRMSRKRCPIFAFPSSFCNFASCWD